MNRISKITVYLALGALIATVVSAGGVAAQDVAEITDVTGAQPDGEFEVTYEYEVDGEQEADTVLTIDPEDSFDVNIINIEGDGTSFSNPDRDDADSRENTDGVAQIVTFNTDGEATVTVDIIGGEDGDQGQIELEITNGNVDAQDTATFNLAGDEDETGNLSSDNPFGDGNNEPLQRSEVIDRVVQWNLNGSIDGTTYTRQEIINFVVEWNLAT